MLVIADARENLTGWLPFGGGWMAGHKGAVAFDSEVVACLGVRVCRDWAGWPLAWSRSDLAFW